MKEGKLSSTITEKSIRKIINRAKNDYMSEFDEHKKIH